MIFIQTAKYTCIVVDNDEIDRLTVVSHIRHFTELHLAGNFSNAKDGLSFTEKNKIDIAFLDVDMEGESGLEMRKKIMDIPVCIFISAYPDYAIESFEVAAFDFLAKPFTAARFSATMQRCFHYLEVLQKAALLEYSLGQDIIVIKQGSENIKIKFHEILYLEALKDYTSIVTAHKKYCVLSSIGNLLKETNFQSFVRIHRSYAVQKNYITKKDTHEVYLDNIALPIGKTYKHFVDLLS